MFFLSWGEYMLDWCKLLTLAWSKFRVTKVQPSNTLDLRWIWLKTSGVNLEVPLQKPEPTNIKTTSSQNRLLAAPAMKHAEVMCCIFFLCVCVCLQYSATVGICCQLMSIMGVKAPFVTHITQQKPENMAWGWCYKRASQKTSDLYIQTGTKINFFWKQQQKTSRG